MITKNVVFDKHAYEIIKKFADDRSYGERGFSIALRHIIMEWDELQNQRVVGVEQLPRPKDAQPVPLVFVAPAE